MTRVDLIDATLNDIPGLNYAPLRSVSYPWRPHTFDGTSVFRPFRLCSAIRLNRNKKARPPPPSNTFPVGIARSNKSLPNFSSHPCS